MTDTMTNTQPRRALILDDNDGNRMLLKFAMQMGKIENVEARTANEALQLWQPGAFTFAFLDIELPDISGLEIARRMRISDPSIAIVMCSTNDDPLIVAEAVNAGCDVFLVKPFQLDTLLTLVKNMDNTVLRAEKEVLIVDNMARSRHAARPTKEYPAVTTPDAPTSAPMETPPPAQPDF